MSTSPYVRGESENHWVKTDAQISTMHSDFKSVKTMIQIWCDRVVNNNSSLTPSPLPSSITFGRPDSCTGTAVLNRKRRRPLSDVDGECFQKSKKKRRLRLYLITSRLSSDYSSPATYIYDRDQSKSAWAKKPMGRNILRKAAMVNRFRRRTLAAQEEAEQKQYNNIRPLPDTLQESPPDLSYYTALDLEDEDEENDADEEGMEFELYEED